MWRISTFESSLHEIERAEAGLKPGARSAFEDDDLFADRWNGHGPEQQTGRAHRGDGQFAGTEVMRVADLNHMEARVDVNENDVVNVKVGERPTSRSMPTAIENFTATFIKSPTLERRPAPDQEEVTNFEVKIRIEDHDVTLRPGLSCTADIETNMVKDVVAVPMQSGHDPDRR